MRVIDQHYHRNGSSGEGFVVSRLEDEDEEEPRTMVVISFFEDDDNDTLSVERTATLDLHLACEGNTRFGVGGNSHRAEYFGPIVREAWQERRTVERLLAQVGQP